MQFGSDHLRGILETSLVPQFGGFAMISAEQGLSSAALAVLGVCALTLQTRGSAVRQRLFNLATMVLTIASAPTR